MTDRPIIFSAPMARALLDGRKTQTRRVLKPQPKVPFKNGVWYRPFLDSRQFHFMGRDHLIHGYHDVAYSPGDRLWVREAHALVPYTAYLHSDGVEMTAHAGTYEAAIYREGFDRAQGGIRWRSSIHMPRWASRLTLTVTDVRVQRLQEISEADAVAEGVEYQAPTPDDLEWHRQRAAEHGYDPDADPMRGVWIAPGTRQGYGMTKEDRDRPQWGPTAAFAFRCLWNSLHGPDAWDANPWIVALTFDVERRNIDAVAA